MTTTRRPSRLALAIALATTAALATGCALTRKTPPVDIRYFSPEPALPAARAPALTAAPVPLRLGRVDRADVLGHRIVQRTSVVELALYETRRWTERPDAYVRRALLHALFDERPLAETRARSAPTLEVEVLAFEEVLAPRHVGRVQLRFVLHDHRAVLVSGQIAADAPVSGEGFDAVVLAIAAANRDATAQIADRVMRELCPDATTH